MFHWNSFLQNISFSYGNYYLWRFLFIKMDENYKINKNQFLKLSWNAFFSRWIVHGFRLGVQNVQPQHTIYCILCGSGLWNQKRHHSPFHRCSTELKYRQLVCGTGIPTRMVCGTLNNALKARWTHSCYCDRRRCTPGWIH